MRNEVIREILHKEETLVDKINKKRLTLIGLAVLQEWTKNNCHQEQCTSIWKGLGM